MLINKYYESIKIYLSMPKDMGFEYMEVILDEMVEEGRTFGEAYALFGELVDFVIDMERV